jgi:hypothetical protein
VRGFNEWEAKRKYEANKLGEDRTDKYMPEAREDAQKHTYDK